MTIRIGIDLGGTKTEIIALDSTGAARLRHREPTPVHDYEATLALVCRMVDDAERELGARATVGIGTPGAASPATGLLRNSNSVCLNGKPLQQDLERRLGRAIRIANDANCFALSEARDGAGADGAVVFGVILGTGVGGGVVVNGHVLTGANRIETFLSGPGLAHDHERVTGERLDAATVVQRAADGDARAEATLARYEHRLARALASVVNVLDPDVIVLGGGLSNVERLYVNVPRLWADWVFSDVTHTRLARNRHGDSSGVRGAAWLPDEPVR